MNIFKNPYAEWKFQGYHKAIEHKTFMELSLIEKRKFTISRIYNLREILKSFYKFDLLKVDSFYINDLAIKLEDNRTDNFETILNIINEEEIKSWSFSLRGKTSLSQMGKMSNKEGVFEIFYESVFDLITIETYSDVWQPFNTFGENLNIADALKNSNRLECCLKEIKNNGLFETIEPDEREELNEIALQYGFRMYYSEATLKKFYPNLHLEQVTPFVWEKRKRK